jgi:hypothetical protein
MTTARRLGALEASLSPTELVLRWLAEAHSYDNWESYMRALLDVDPGDFPMDRLTREARTSAQQRSRGRPREEAERAVRTAVIDAGVRFQIVLNVNVRSQDFLDREALVNAALTAHVGLAVNCSEERLKAEPLRMLVQARDLLFRRVNELHAFETARTTVEARYFDGTTVDFPAVRRAWAEQRTLSETTAVMAMHIAELDGAETVPPDDQAAFDARVEQIAADLVEPARSKAYDELGDGRRAIELAVRWLRPKLVAEGAGAGLNSASYPPT